MPVGRKMAAAAMGLTEPLIPEPTLPTEVYVGDSKGDDIGDIDNSQTKQTPSNVIITTTVCFLAVVSCKMLTSALLSSML